MEGETLVATDPTQRSCRICSNFSFLFKGQIISKGLFGVLELYQTQTNEFVVVVETNWFVRFLGEFEDTKSPFEII